MSAYVELIMDQGTTFRNIINLTDDVTNVALNITGYSVNSQMRRSYYSANASATFVCNITDAANGEITMFLSAANTSTIKAGRYLFDMEITDAGGIVNRVLEGIVTVTPQITK